jgi:hypothetical protein
MKADLGLLLLLHGKGYECHQNILSSTWGARQVATPKAGLVRRVPQTCSIHHMCGVEVPGVFLPQSEIL